MDFFLSDKLVYNLLKPRFVVEGGKEYLVSSITVMREQVMNGNQGPIFYPFQWIESSASQWDGVPLLNYHPNEPVPARNDTRIIYNQGLGFIRNAQASKPLLKAEAWFDVVATQRVNAPILNALKEGKKIEVSSGLYLTPQDGSGSDEFGATYNQVATNFIPDHVAVLIDTVGACSLKNGCGVNNELSFRTTRMELSRQLNEQFPNGINSDYAHVIDVFKDRVIFERGEKVWELGYNVETGDSIRLDSSPVEVRKIVTFEPVTNEADEMATRQEQISWLVENCGTCKTLGTDILNSFPETKLNELRDKAEKSKPAPTNNQDNPAPVPVPPTPEKVETVTNDRKPVNAQDWIKEAPVEVQEVFNSAKEIVSNERLKLETSVNGLIKTSVLNEERQSFYLNSVPARKIKELRELEELMKGMQKTDKVQNYGGQAPTVSDPISAIEDLTQTHNADPTAQPLELPSLA